MSAAGIKEKESTHWVVGTNLPGILVISTIFIEYLDSVFTPLYLEPYMSTVWAEGVGLQTEFAVFGLGVPKKVPKMALFGTFWDPRGWDDLKFTLEMTMEGVGLRHEGGGTDPFGGPIPLFPPLSCMLRTRSIFENHLWRIAKSCIV